jgi:hypothetical protein
LVIVIVTTPAVDLDVGEKLTVDPAGLPVAPKVTFSEYPLAGVKLIA